MDQLILSIASHQRIDSIFMFKAWQNILAELLNNGIGNWHLVITNRYHFGSL